MCIVTAEVVKDASDLLVDDTRFWVVRPRISGGTVSGLGTLLSGSFVGMDAGGSPKRAPATHRARDAARHRKRYSSGALSCSKGKDMGSVDAGTPIFYRRLQVGLITSFRSRSGW